ncbi:MAG: ATP-binding protein [Desulfovibrionaceae bacterium]|nr:ATP-binding protein [Desulfovibrionaceae bacterium]
MKRPFLGMQGKIMLLAVPFIVIFVGLLSLVTLEREKGFALENAMQQAIGIARSAGLLFTNARIYEEMGMMDSAGISDYLEFFMADRMQQEPRIRAFMVINPQGQVLAHSDVALYGLVDSGQDTQQALHTKTMQAARRKTAQGQEYLAVRVPLAIGSKFWGVCGIDFSLEKMHADIRALQQEIIIVGAVFLFFSLPVIWLGGRHFVRPVRRLTQAINAITVRGDVHTPLPALPARDDEIGTLQTSFFWMITRLRAAEEQRQKDIEGIVQTAKLATVGQLASGVAHEINNPLGGVILCFNNLVEGGMDENMRRQHEQVITQGLEKIRVIVKELLHFARPAPLEIGEADVQTLFAHCLALAEYPLTRQGVRVLREIEPNLPAVRLDAAKMGQVLVNLLLNAAQAFETQGADAAGKAVLLRACRDGERLCLMVADTGKGISSDHAAHIFDPFFTTKAPDKGTGLGLAVSRNIVVQHGGTLTLELGAPQAEGIVFGGAVFAIRIPFSKAG